MFARVPIRSLPRVFRFLPQTSYRQFAMSATKQVQKRIVICCDGTWDDSDVLVLRALWRTTFNKTCRIGNPATPTNVTKIARSITDHDTLPDGNVVPQVVFYQSGIGSKSATDANHSIDGLTGRGIKENVRQAYGFICSNYVPGDDIILIGFSRGAYTARVISSLITDLGILKKHGLGYFFGIFDAWQKKGQEDKFAEGGKATVTFAQIQENLKDPKNDLAYWDVPIKACAVWDTVGALGIPIKDPQSKWAQMASEAGAAVRAALANVATSAVNSELNRYNPLAFTFVNTIVSPKIEYAFHAVALDEHRIHFTPTIWEKPDGQEWPKLIKQCWFTGTHTLIGGGNTNNNEMPNIALAWMIAQLASNKILQFDCSKVRSTARDEELAKLLSLRGEADPNSGKMVDSSSDPMNSLDAGPPRTPTQYFRVDPVTEKPTDVRLQNTYETIHSSVRLRFWDRTDIMPDGSKYESKALKGKWLPFSPGTATTETATTETATTETATTVEAAAAGRWVVDAASATATTTEHAAESGLSGLLHGMHLPGSVETPAEKTNKQPLSVLHDLPEDEMTDVEANILKQWSSGGDSLGTYNLQAVTH